MRADRRTLACALALCLAGLHGPAGAQAETRPLRIIVPYASGGTTDQVARLLQAPLEEALGRPVIVENKPGASGTIGTDYVARAPADGNTLVFGNPAPSAFLPALRKVGYDPVGDFVPISTVAVMPMFLVVPAQASYGSLDDFLQRAARAKGGVAYGSSGVGSLAHLTGAYFAQQAGLDMLHIPYVGGAPMMLALFQGDLQATFTTGLDGAAMVRSGQARYLATAAERRDPAMPDLPAIGERLKGFRSVAWFALFAPKGTPAPIATTLRNAVRRVVAKDDFRRFLEERHAEARASTAEELGQLVQQDIRQWSDVVRSSHITLRD